jgi:hypothetical protein
MMANAAARLMASESHRRAAQADHVNDDIDIFV